MKPNRMLITLMALALIWGCSNENYLVERAYWHLSRDAQRILRSQDSVTQAEREKLNRALRLFIKKHPSVPQAVSAQFLLAKVTIEQGHFEETRRITETIIQRYSTHPEAKKIASEALFLAGQSRERAGEWQEALKVYAQISEEYAETLRAYLLPAYIARYYLRNREGEKATEANRAAAEYYLKQADTFAGTNTGYNSLLLAAQAFRSVKDWTQTVRTLERIAAAYPDKPQRKALMLQAADIYEFELKDRQKAAELKARVADLGKKAGRH